MSVRRDPLRFEGKFLSADAITECQGRCTGLKIGQLGSEILCIACICSRNLVHIFLNGQPILAKGLGPVATPSLGPQYWRFHTRASETQPPRSLQGAWNRAIEGANKDDDLIMENMHLDEVFKVLYVAADQLLKHFVNL